MYQIEFTNEAVEELKTLDKPNQKRVFRVLKVFEELGQSGVNSRQISPKGLFEIKTDKVRIYYTYEADKLIVIALITLKKTQKAPERYKEQAFSRVAKYLEQRNKQEQ